MYGNMENAREFRELVNQQKRGGRRRHEILSYIAKNPGATPYKITKRIFGEEVPLHYKAVLEHLKKLEKIGVVIKTRREDGAYKISLTEDGKYLCISAGVELPSKGAEEFIKLLDNLSGPLAPAESRKISSLLTDVVWNTSIKVAKIAGGYFHPLPKELKLSQQILRALWFYDIERKVLEKFKGRLEFIANDLKKYFITLPLVQERKLEQNFDELAHLLAQLTQRSPLMSDFRDSCYTMYIMFRLFPAPKKKKVKLIPLKLSPLPKRRVDDISC